MIVKVDHLDDFIVIRSTFEQGEYVLVDEEHINEEKKNLSIYCGRFQWRFKDKTIINKNSGDGFTRDIYDSWINDDTYLNCRFIALDEGATTHCIKSKNGKIYDRDYYILDNEDSINVNMGQYLYCAEGTLYSDSATIHAPSLVFCQTKDFQFKVKSENSIFMIFQESKNDI